MDVRELIDDGFGVVLSVSGGKDSTAAGLWLKEQGIPFRCIHMDTGWEHPDTVRYVREVLPPLLGPIEVLSAGETLPEMVRRKSSFPSRTARWCTQQLKVEPARQWMDALGAPVVNVVGIRAEESASRSKMAEWEESDWFDGWSWRPLLRWSYQEVIDIHTRHGVRPNPLYLRGAERVGCWPCIHARKSEIRRIAEQDPVRIGQIRELERVAGDDAEAREQARHDRAVEAMGWPGATVDEVIDHVRQKGQRKPARAAIARVWAMREGLIDDWREWFNRPAWFQNPSTRRGDGLDGACWPIDKVVEWSQTAHGGRQFELFAAPDRDQGCMRWGLCDTGRAATDSDE